MKSDLLIRAVGGIDDDLIEAAEAAGVPSGSRQRWTRWGAVAAAFMLVTAVAFGAPRLLDAGKLPPISPAPPATATGGTTPTLPPATLPGGAASSAETAFSMKYVYKLTGSPFDSYVGGKVIDPAKVGDRIAPADTASGYVIFIPAETGGQALPVFRVTGGWIDASGTSLTQEYGDAELFTVAGVSPEVAVVVHFLDKFEALTTDHWYVMLNPAADTTAVQDYVIPSETAVYGPSGEIPE